MKAYIYTDASYFQEHKIGSFAFWIECRGKTLQGSGILKDTIGSTEAETMCICNALHTFIWEDFKRITDIVITTDSQQSVLKINAKAKPDSPYRKAYDLLMDIRKENGIKTRLKNNIKHVVAHTKPDTIEKMINKWCDMEARKVGRAHIKSLYKTDKYKDLSTQELADKLTFKNQ